MALDPMSPSAMFLAFWQERHLCTLTTPRPDGTPHVVPVGVTYDPAAGLARVIARKGSAKVQNILAAGPRGVPVAVCQVDHRRWATLEGQATVSADPAAVAEAERRYAQRYRVPGATPDRVVIEIALRRALGNVA